MKEEIDIKDFQKVDVRIGTVVDAVVPTWSHWVMKLTVDFGDEIGTRTIFAGIMKFFAPENVKGRQMPFVVNMKPKRIGPANENGEYEYSEGMMMAANVPSADGNEENDQPVLFKLDEPVPDGVAVM